MLVQMEANDSRLNNTRPPIKQLAQKERQQQQQQKERKIKRIYAITASFQLCRTNKQTRIIRA